MERPNQRAFTNSSCGVAPHDGMSAGFLIPGQWLQQSIEVRSRISATWFWTATQFCLVTEACYILGLLHRNNNVTEIIDLE